MNGSRIVPLGLLGCFVVAGAASAPAQQAERPDSGRRVRMLLGEQVVDCDACTVVADLALAGRWRGAELIAAPTYAIADVLVDADAGQVLRIMAERVSLLSLDQKAIWSVDGTAAHVDAAAGSPRWLAQERVVLGRTGGGLVALERGNGALAWQRPELPTERLLLDGDLVITAGMVAGVAKLHAVALANGARAFDAVLDEAATALVAAAHGIAVVGASGVCVYDRTGPLLFRAAGRPAALVGGPDGWFAASDGKVSAWTRTGAEKWSVPLPAPAFDRQQLVVLADGRLLHLEFQPIADSGFQAVCFAAADGAVDWRRTEPGLDVPHSKYWHRVHARAVGERLFVTSQGASGCFLVELDAATGARRAREQFATK